jgi:hypothetical protein
MSNVLAFRRPAPDTGEDFGPTGEASTAENTSVRRSHVMNTLHTKSADELDAYTGRAVPIDDLYPGLLGVGPELNTVLSLLARAIEYIDAAISDYESDDLIASDDGVRHLEGIMADLVSCREVGDGYGNIIMSIHNSLLNRGGTPLNNPQLRMVVRALTLIRNEPFMAFDKSIDMVTQLEEAGLNVEPAGLEQFVDLVNA